LAVSYEDRQGLVTVPESRAGQSLKKITDTLTHCSFTKDIGHGACVRESVTTPPELVDVRMSDGTVVTSVSVNPRYANVRKLQVAPAEWTNRYGNRSTGYITRSSLYSEAKRLPTILVTHGHDATNSFAPEGHQWEVPVQVLAEKGFLVLSVNEPTSTAQSREASETKVGSRSMQSTADIQFYDAFNVVAGMEAALNSAVEKGLTDPDKTGIAGFSRGSEIVEWAMTQSTLFHVAIEGDAGGSVAGRYGLASPPARVRIQQLYGGSPFDPAALPSYQKLSVSFRSTQFAGPLLQLFAQGHGVAGLELHALLQDAGIPTDLVYFPNENHIFWGPRHRAAAMQRSIDWFEYWLLGKRNEAGISQGDYARWDAMAAAWKKTRQ
jgi:dipeptidyl aminopeptidase/acylaminoacyl peptidase